MVNTWKVLNLACSGATVQNGLLGAQVLGSGQVAAYEALARGPVGSPLESPAALFATARVAGRLTELEWACRAAAPRLRGGTLAP